jgi:uncharacterized protein (DUF2141 family)
VKNVGFFAALSMGLALPIAVHAEVLGEDKRACTTGGNTAILANIIGLKDRTGRLKLELWRANDDEFLHDDWVLQGEGKFFHRVWAKPPASGDVSMCIKAPGPGSYALFFTHDRDGKNKFNFWMDGGGFPNAGRLGRNRPTLEQAQVTVGIGVTTVTIRAQYLRGIFAGFGPIES